MSLGRLQKLGAAQGWGVLVGEKLKHSSPSIWERHNLVVVTFEIDIDDALFEKAVQYAEEHSLSVNEVFEQAATALITELAQGKQGKQNDFQP